MIRGIPRVVLAFPDRDPDRRAERLLPDFSWIRPPLVQLKQPAMAIPAEGLEFPRDFHESVPEADACPLHSSPVNSIGPILSQGEGNRSPGGRTLGRLRLDRV